MLSDITPFRMAGNLYFVGTYKASSHLIDTGDGLILMDAGYAETADVIGNTLGEGLGISTQDTMYQKMKFSIIIVKVHCLNFMNA